MSTTVQAGAFLEGITQARDEERAMLEICLQAFDAIPTSAASRKMLKKLGKTPGAYAGNGSHILAREMAAKLRDHLGLAREE